MRRELWMSALCLVLLVSGTRPISVTARPVLTLPYLALSRPDRGRVFAVTWSPDGQFVAVGTETGLWLYTNTLTDVQHVAIEPIHALAWSPDGNMLAIGSFGERGQQVKSTVNEPDHIPIMGGGLQLWAVYKQDAFFTLAQHSILFKDGSVFALRFSPDGQQLASLSEDAYLEYSDEETQQNTLRVNTLGASPQPFMAIASWTEIAQNKTTTQGASLLSWTHDGRYLAIGRAFTDPDRHEAGTIWDSVTRNFVAMGVAATGSEFGAVAYNPDDTTLAIGYVTTIDPNAFGGLLVCHVEAALFTSACAVSSPLVTEQSPNNVPTINNVSSVAWHPTHPWLAYTTGTAITLWNSDKQHSIGTLDAANEAVTMLEWNLDGSKLLSVGSDYVVRIWTRFTSYQTLDPTPIQTLTMPTAASDLNAEAIVSPNGQLLALKDEQTQSVHIIRIADSSVQATFLPLGGKFYLPAAHWSPDSTQLAVSNSTITSCNFNQQTTQIWSAQTGALTIDLGSTVGIAWRPDSKAVAEFDGDNILTTVEIDNGRVLQTTELGHVQIHDHILYMSAWSPDSRLIALNDIVMCGLYATGSALLWNTNTQKIAAHVDVPRFSYRGSGGEAEINAWSADGSLVAVSGFDHNYVYRLTWSNGNLQAVAALAYLANSPFCGIQEPDTTLFSPDGRYFLCDNTVWDMTTLWPVAHFRSTMRMNVYRWVGDTLIGYDLYGDLYNNFTKHIPGKIIMVRTSDFLPSSPPTF